MLDLENRECVRSRFLSEARDSCIAGMTGAFGKNEVCAAPFPLLCTFAGLLSSRWGKFFSGNEKGAWQQNSREGRCDRWRGGTTTGEDALPRPVRPLANPRFRAKSTSACRVADTLGYRRDHPVARLFSTRVHSSHLPSRFRAGAPLLQWGTLVKSRAKRPIFAPEAPFVAGGFRELTHPPAGAGTTGGEDALPRDRYISGSRC